MKNFLVPLVALLSLFLAQIIGGRSATTQPSQPDPNTKYMWLEVYTYDLPAGLLTPGKHIYQFNFQYSEPEPGAQQGRVRTVEVSPEAVVHQGYALLRPGGIQAEDLSGGCSVYQKVNPDQPVRLMVAWVPDVHYTEDEFNRQIRSMKATVRWDEQPPVEMTAQLTTKSWEPLWNCKPWVNPSGLAWQAAP